MPSFCSLRLADQGCVNEATFSEALRDWLSSSCPFVLKLWGQWGALWESQPRSESDLDLNTSFAHFPAG